MPLTFAGTLGRDVLPRACRAVLPLVSAPDVADAWDRESALPGFTVGGVARHLVSQAGVRRRVPAHPAGAVARARRCR